MVIVVFLLVIVIDDVVIVGDDIVVFVVGFDGVLYSIFKFLFCLFLILIKLEY